MRLTVRFLGLELFTFEASTDDAESPPDSDLSGGTTASMPIGFAASHGDQRWESAPDLE